MTHYKVAVPKELFAYIDSMYHGSTVDGEGLRSVIFFNGCNLRCPFCHNPETLYKTGERHGLTAVFDKVMRYKSYIDGVTLSGGEPFLQAEFCLALCERLRQAGMNTVIETNGTVVNGGLIRAADGIRVDIKNQAGESFEVLIERYAPFLESCDCPVTLTNVLVPSLNDSDESLSRLKRLSKRFPCVTGIKLLPFKKLCEAKYAALGMPFPFADKAEATTADVRSALTRMETL